MAFDGLSVAACGFSMAGCRTPDAGLDLRGGGGSSCCWGVSVVISALTYDWRGVWKGREKRRDAKYLGRGMSLDPGVGVLAGERYTANCIQNPNPKWSRIGLQLRRTPALRTMFPWRMQNALTEREREEEEERVGGWLSSGDWVSRAGRGGSPGCHSGAVTCRVAISCLNSPSCGGNVTYCAQPSSQTKFDHLSIS